MERVIERRIASNVVLLVALSFVIFAVAWIAESSVKTLSPASEPQPAERSFVPDYVAWISSMATGDIRWDKKKQPEKNPIVTSGTVAILAVGWATSIAAPLAWLGLRRRAWSRVGDGLAAVTASLPTVAVGLLLLLVFGIYLQWVPVSGQKIFARYFLPSITVSIVAVAPFLNAMRKIARELRASPQPILRAVERAIAAWIATVVASLPMIFGATLFVDTIFALDGLGFYVFQGVIQADVQPIRAGLFAACAIVVVMRSVADALKFVTGRGRESRIMPRDAASLFAPQIMGPHSAKWPRRLAIALAACVVALFAVAALSDFDPAKQDAQRRLINPIWGARGSVENILGTDAFGRDVLVRLVHAIATSLWIAALVTLASAGVGILLGFIARRLGRLAEAALSFIDDLQWALPTVAFLWVVIAVFAVLPAFLMIALITLMWVRFIAIGRAIASPPAQRSDVLRRMGWTSLSAIVAVFLIETSASFLGLGVQPPAASLGTMIAEGRNFMFFKPYLIVIPSIAATLIVLALSTLRLGLFRQPDDRGAATSAQPVGETTVP